MTLVLLGAQPLPAADCTTALATLHRYGEAEETFAKVPEATARAYAICGAEGMPLGLRNQSVVRYASLLPGAERLKFLENALSRTEIAGAGASGEVLPLLDALASAYQEARRNGEALALLERGSKIRIAVFGESSAEAAHGLLLLGFHHGGMQDFVLAERYFRAAVDAARKGCGPRCETLAMALSALTDLVGAIPGREAERAELDAMFADAWPVEARAAARRAAKQAIRAEGAATRKLAFVEQYCGPAPRSLAEVVVRDRIVRVKITRSELDPIRHDGNVLVATRLDADVIESIRGDAKAGDAIEILQRAGRYETETMIIEVADAVAFKRGDEAVLSLAWNPVLRVYETGGPSWEFPVVGGKILPSTHQPELLSETADIPVERFVARLREAAASLK